MPYHIRAEVTNRTSTPQAVTIYPGTIFQVTNPIGGVQNLATTTKKTVTVRPGATRIIHVPAWCLNRRYSPPRKTPMSPSIFRTARPYATQDEAWADMESRDR
jgi:hypothetical protein